MRHGLLYWSAQVVLVAPLCRKEGIAVVSYQVLQGGLLTGKYTDPDAPPEGSRAVENPEVAHRAGGWGRDGGGGPTQRTCRRGGAEPV
ncbi:MAG TPA: hypothetical protein EYQ18_25750 [Candidatus Handelsmanbacteria bacterium]|nr:hypothetical protein [Candidatus Handelsmanbacteria bacterium]